MTTADKLNAVINSKQNIKDAIEAKGVTVGSAPLSQYAEKIEEIEDGADLLNEEAVVYKSASEVDYYSKRNVVRPYSFNGQNPDSEQNLTLTINFMTDITSVDFYALRHLNNLTLNFKDLSKITSIGNYAFVETDSNLNLNDMVNLESIGQGAFIDSKFKTNENEKLIIPESVTSVGRFCFQGCDFIEVETPTSLHEIDGYTFRFNERLVRANLKGATNVKENVFQHCSALSEVTIGSPGNPVTMLAYDVFERCRELTTINIYVSNPNSPGLTGAPWGATNATITYLQA